MANRNTLNPGDRRHNPVRRNRVGDPSTGHVGERKGVYYCKPCDDDYRCDITAFIAKGPRWLVNVQRFRLSPEIELPTVDYASLRSFTMTFDVQREVAMEAEQSGKVVRIGLAYDGKSYECSSRRAFHNLLMELKRAGYRIPHSVLRRVRRELDEDNIAAEEKRRKARMIRCPLD